MKRNVKVAIACAVLAGLVAISQVALRSDGGRTKTSYSQFIEQVKAGEVDGVVVGASSDASPASYRLKDGRTERTVLPANYKDALTAMQNAGVNVEIEDTSSNWRTQLKKAAPFLLLLGVWVILMMRGKPNWRGLGGLT